MMTCPQLKSSHRAWGIHVAATLFVLIPLLVCANTLAPFLPLLLSRSPSSAARQAAPNGTSSACNAPAAIAAVAVAQDAGSGLGGVTRGEEQQQGAASDVSTVEQLLRYTEGIEARRGQNQSDVNIARVLEVEAKQWRQRTYQQRGFIYQFSAYRISPSRFVVLGISRLDFLWVKEGEGCRWVGRDGSSVNGTVRYRDFMHPKSKNDALAAFCQLAGNTSRAGGYLAMTMDGVEAAVFTEEAGEPLEPPPDDSLPVRLTWCSQPLYGALDEGAVWVWAEYHRARMGVQRFVFYDMAAWTPQLTAVFQPYFDARIAAITDMSAGFRLGFLAGGGARAFVSKHQTLANNDCMFRSLATSRWVTLHDTDEFLAPVPPHSLPSLLAAYSQAAWLSHGALVVELSVCDGGPKEGSEGRNGSHAAESEGSSSEASATDTAATETADAEASDAAEADAAGAEAARAEKAEAAGAEATEASEAAGAEAAAAAAKRKGLEVLSKLVFRRPEVWCVKDGAKEPIEPDLCEDWRGHRKLVVNPRKTSVMSIHVAREPQKGGVVLNAGSELRHYHLSGVVNPANVHCDTLVPPGESHVWFVRDTTIADQLSLLANASAPQPVV
ncbi:hypothetical protein CLOM_g8814 [Closterium sp. NIES-68]|nr:hypothetical protein CLOM_g8814 [Closterium sp. NIES-68]GJP60041.1 hypothetical protein CLOP_g17183 [Closterium sp. NIES-67]